MLKSMPLFGLLITPKINGLLSKNQNMFRTVFLNQIVTIATEIEYNIKCVVVPANTTNTILVMLNLSSYSNCQNYQGDSELSDRHVSSSSEKPRLPRHISSLESPSHSRVMKARLHQAPEKCPLNQNTSPVVASNQAVNMLRYQLQDTAFAEKYLENVRRNLQYRLEVAQVEEKCQLVTMLQEEVRQLEASI
jgi:hypothetical protein